MRNRVPKKQAEARVAAPQPPLTPEQLLGWDNVIKHGSQPAELKGLKSSNSFHLPAGGHLHPETALTKVDAAKGVSAWHFDSDQGVVQGLPGRALSLASPDESRKAGGRPTPHKAHVPEWSDLVYHPKLSGAGRPRPIRRRNGERAWPNYVFGPDSRLPFYPSGYPWQCIGRLFVWTDASNPNFSYSGTASLVGPNFILTAGHMVPWGSANWKAQFVPAYYNGSSTLGATVYSYCESAHGWNPYSSGTAHDYAVMKLYDALGGSLGHFGVQTYDESWDDGNYWMAVGYPGAVAGAQQPSFQQGFSFHDDDEDGDGMELETDDDAQTPGDSGGPAFHWWSDGWPYIIGVNSSSEDESGEDNNIVAGGADMSSLISWAYSNW